MISYDFLWFSYDFVWFPMISLWFPMNIAYIDKVHGGGLTMAWQWPDNGPTMAYIDKVHGGCALTGPSNTNVNPLYAGTTWSWEISPHLGQGPTSRLASQLAVKRTWSAGYERLWLDDTRLQTARMRKNEALTDETLTEQCSIRSSHTCSTKVFLDTLPLPPKLASRNITIDACVCAIGCDWKAAWEQKDMCIPFVCTHRASLVCPTTHKCKWICDSLDLRGIPRYLFSKMYHNWSRSQRFKKLVFQKYQDSTPIPNHSKISNSCSKRCLI